MVMLARLQVFSRMSKFSPGLRRTLSLKWANGSVSFRELCAFEKDELNAGTEEAALYVHWPYCEKRCTYCNFNKYIARSVDHDVMRESLVQETKTLICLSQVKKITSVFLGGGTPSLARPSTIAAVLETVAKHTYLPENTEVTLEANPMSSGASRLAEFKAAGVSRLSVGVQSLNDADLEVLGRNHTSHDALQTLEEARKLFPGRTSVDIIFGLPHQSVESWERELEELLLVCDDHISLYQLTLERGTALFKLVQNGILSMPEHEATAEMYEAARRTLESSGFQQYEVSNFAKNGAVSFHNLAYWQGKQYIGIGPGAHGRFVPWGNGKTQREARIQTLEPDVWMKEVQQYGHGTRKRVPQNKLDVLEEALVLGLRMTEGLAHQHWLQYSSAFSLQELCEQSQEMKDLQDEGLLILDERGLRCSWKGLAVLDSLLPALLNQLQLSFSVKPLRMQ
ncbi:radical S-adenosyl methionine domain-containing protein 1, mitochondrial [Latimeria chalumnae]|uniref:Radical S-adenosyl methionine domain-containing protein n=1 Tax=Latimeria chalumnae TaxID=7897 RepID=H3B3Y2_LATCH|nr:PREDICTED: radical S-adenosyl methionine domain-containing protein 1, mitochondrial [Latimeria chalumnae]|eukprot:XP_005999660.1 PREDICTED: radical S-adenosyl methionine domain-containing protein 1, mitochondrial [Latimeria chalumnae]